MAPEINISLSRTVRAAVIKSGLQRAFVNRVARARDHKPRLVIVSPWITSTGDANCSLAKLTQLITARRIPTFVFTRRPAKPEHLEAVQMFTPCKSVEIVYNDNIHAKIYACIAPPPYGFGIMGSANMTANSLSLYEIGLLVIGEGPGSAIVSDLANFGLQFLRTRPESKLAKRISH